MAKVSRHIFKCAISRMKAGMGSERKRVVRCARHMSVVQGKVVFRPFTIHSIMYMLLKQGRDGLHVEVSRCTFLSRRLYLWSLKILGSVR